MQAGLQEAERSHWRFILDGGVKDARWSAAVPSRDGRGGSGSAVASGRIRMPVSARPLAACAAPPAPGRTRTAVRPPDQKRAGASAGHAPVPQTTRVPRHRGRHLVLRAGRASASNVSAPPGRRLPGSLLHTPVGLLCKMVSSARRSGADEGLVWSDVGASVDGGQAVELKRQPASTRAALAPAWRDATAQVACDFIPQPYHAPRPRAPAGAIMPIYTVASCGEYRAGHRDSALLLRRTGPLLRARCFRPAGARGRYGCRRTCGTPSPLVDRKVSRDAACCSRASRCARRSSR